MRWLTGHKKDVRSVVYAPDGRLVSGGSDRTVRIWDQSSGDCITTIKAMAPVYAVAVSPDSATLAYAGRYARGADSNSVFLCDWGGKTIRQFGLRFERAYTERIPSTFDFEQVMRPQPRSIWSLAFSADGSYLAAASRYPGGANIPNGGGGRVWAVGSKSKEALANLVDDAYSVGFGPSGEWMGVTRRSAVLFCSARCQPGDIAYQYPTSSEWSAAVAFVPGTDLAVVASNSYLYFLNSARQEKARRVKTGIRVVTGVAASPDGRTVFAGGKPGSVEVYDVASMTRTTTFDFGIGGVHGLAIAPDGLTFAVAGDKGLLVCDVG